jgi:hypothetical protein
LPQTPPGKELEDVCRRQENQSPGGRGDSCGGRTGPARRIVRPGQVVAIELSEPVRRSRQSQYAGSRAEPIASRAVAVHYESWQSGPKRDFQPKQLILVEVVPTLVESANSDQEGAVVELPEQFVHHEPSEPFHQVPGGSGAEYLKPRFRPQSGVESAVVRCASIDKPEQADPQRAVIEAVKKF